MLSIRGMNYGMGGNTKNSGELKFIKLLNDLLKDKNDETIIFDIGANNGDYSLALVDLLNIKATIHSFEPSKPTFKILVKNVKKISNIQTHNFGFSNVEDELLLYKDFDTTDLASVYHLERPFGGRELILQEKIIVKKLDDFTDLNQIKEIHFLKIDVEGHELAILHGASSLIAENRISIIQFEFGTCNIDSKTYFRDFWNLLSPKYKIYRMVQNGISEIIAYHEILEIFQTTNFVALHKETLKPSF